VLSDWWASAVTLAREVAVMTVSGAERSSALPGPRRRETVAEQARRRGIGPVTSMDQVVRDDVFESDEELDAFLDFVRASRRSDLA
jgi:hypothetical protein